MSRHSTEGSGGNNHASIWEIILGRKKQEVSQVWRGQECDWNRVWNRSWGLGPLGDDKEPTFMASAMVRTLANFRWDAIGGFWKQ